MNRLTNLDKLYNANIAIVKLSSMGDILHALPVLCGLKKQLPQTQISWLVEPQFQELLVGHEDLSQVITLDTKTWRKQLKNPAQAKQTWQAICQSKQQLRDYRFDLTLDLQGLIKSGLVTLTTGAGVRMGFHPKACRESLSALFTNEWVRPAKSLHIIEKNLAFLEHLGLDSTEVQYKLPVTNATRQWAHEWLAQKFPELEQYPLVIIHPGSRWQSKCWPIDNYIQLIQGLQKQRVNLLLSGGPEEEELLEQINSALHEKVKQAIGFSLSRLMALLEHCNLMVASDTGPLHLAVALGKPTVSFYGPTPLGPLRNGPYGSGHIIFYPETPCRGCGKRTCTDLKCMRAITVTNVLKAIRTKLGLL